VSTRSYEYSSNGGGNGQYRALTQKRCVAVPQWRPVDRSTGDACEEIRSGRGGGDGIKKRRPRLAHLLWCSPARWRRPHCPLHPVKTVDHGHEGETHPDADQNLCARTWRRTCYRRRERENQSRPRVARERPVTMRSSDRYAEEGDSPRCPHDDASGEGQEGQSRCAVRCSQVSPEGSTSGRGTCRVKRNPTKRRRESPATVPLQNDFECNKGWATRISIATNMVNSTTRGIRATPTPKASPKPCVATMVNPYTKKEDPAVEVRAPGRS